MKIAVVGAARGIGYELLRIALEEGHDVTALLRNPAKLNIGNSRLKIVKDDILDPTSVTAAILGNDAVCLCIGITPTRKPVNVFSPGEKCVLAAISATLGIGASMPMPANTLMNHAKAETPSPPCQA